MRNVITCAMACALFTLWTTSVDAQRGRWQDNLPTPAEDADFYREWNFDPDEVELGKLLFFDKILSGNENISCASCHHPFAFTGDGLSLPIGEGGMGLGVTRETGDIHERVPRNAPHIFNLGAKEFDVMFHDGRVEIDTNNPSGFNTPLGIDFPTGTVLSNVLEVQAMFPVTSPDEMAGHPGENLIAFAAAVGWIETPGGVWDMLANRLRQNSEYAQLFADVYDDIVTSNDITYAHAAKAMGAFEGVAWRADNSPFDQWLRGDLNAMSKKQKNGMQLFYHKARCYTCHSGTFQSDQDFHAVAMPQIGPGKLDGPSTLEDFGRKKTTNDDADLFKFRTPTLRNVALTAPYGHAGSYDTLEAVVRHHIDPVDALNNYDQSQATLPSRPDLDADDFTLMDDPVLRGKIANANELSPTALSDHDVELLIEFLHALTDRSMLDLRRDVPETVPSGLPVFD